MASIPNEVSQQFDYLNGGPMEKTWGPYATKAAACLALKNIVDADGKNVRMGKTVAIGTETDYIEHWWQGGFDDAHLVPKVPAPDLSYLATKTEATQVKQIVDRAEPKLSSLELVEKDGLYVTDEDGHVAVQITEDGFLKVDTMTVREQFVEHFRTLEVSFDNVEIVDNGSNMYPFSVTDEKGNILSATTSQGMNVNTGSNVVSTKGGSIPTLPSDILHIMSYGQSLSVGHSSTPISTIQLYNILMFQGGIVTNISETAPSDRRDSLVPAIATNSETPMSGAAQMIMEKVIEDYNFSITEQEFRVLISAPGKGGSNIVTLVKGNVEYNNLILDVTSGLARANELGKTYSVGAICWTQGEANASVGDTTSFYYETLKQLLIDLNNDIKAITKQTYDVQFPMYQIASDVRLNPNHYPNIGIALAKICEDLPNAHLATPAYIFDHPDALHLNASGYKWMGAYYGQALKKALIDDRKYTPLSVKSISWQRDILEILFHVPVAPLVFDTDHVVDPGNKGFRITDQLGNIIPITTVKIARADCVKLITATELHPGFHVQYGINSIVGAGPTVGSRGCLRDSQGNTLVFDKYGFNKPLHNWCLIFDITL